MHHSVYAKFVLKIVKVEHCHLISKLSCDLRGHAHFEVVKIVDKAEESQDKVQESDTTGVKERAQQSAGSMR